MLTFLETSHCCWDIIPAKKWPIASHTSHTAYIGQLDTWYQTRQLEHRFSYADGKRETGSAAAEEEPNVWQVPVGERDPKVWEGRSVEVVVPNSKTVVVCGECEGAGTRSCPLPRGNRPSVGHTCEGVSRVGSRER